MVDAQDKNSRTVVDMPRINVFSCDDVQIKFCRSLVPGIVSEIDRRNGMEGQKDADEEKKIKKFSNCSAIKLSLSIVLF